MTTMRTAGRATLFSGATVAIGLALLVFMPLPFMRSMGVGGLLVPLFSIAASATFLPALLARSGSQDQPPPGDPADASSPPRAEGRPGFWTRLSRSIMRRPVLYLVGAGGLMLALALPALQLHLTGGDNRGVPLTTESTKGLALLDGHARPGRAGPEPDRDRHRPARTARRSRRPWPPSGGLVAELRRDPESTRSTIQAPILAGPGPAGARPGAEGQPDRRRAAR